MSKQKKSRVLVAGICLVTLLTSYGLEVPRVYAEMSLENKEKQQEERVYQLLPKGDVKEIRDLHKRQFSFSPYEPTGIYAKPGEEIVIQVGGDQQIKAYIGTYSYENENVLGGPIEFNLNPGENKISSPKGGLLYFYNYNNSGEVTAKVEQGGSTNPLFILGKHTTKDWQRMLAENLNPYAIEMKGENSLLTMHPETVKEHLKQEDPTELLKKHDEILNIESKISGLSKDGVGATNRGKHYVHFVEDWYTKTHMYAMEYRTAYSKGNLKSVLDVEELTADGWGPWHEVGHQHQQVPWLWSELGEVTVNIYSLAVQTTFGHKTRLEKEGRYEKAFAYLDKPDAQEKMDGFEKLVMFWQLYLAYGDQFYPKLHQMYRMLHDVEMPKSDDEKKQMFIYMTSKAAGQNLIPVLVNIGYENSIVFQGNGDAVRSIVTANHNTKKLQATFTDSKVHYRFENEKYMGITLYDQNGNEKKVISVEGQENSKNFAEQLNGIDFAYGDVVEVYHAESERLNWYQNNEFVGKGKGEVEQKLYFKITEHGFERMEAQQEVTAVPQKVVIGTEAEKLDVKNFVQVKDGEVVGFVEKPDTTKIGEQKVKIETKDRFGNKKVTEVPLEVIYGDSLVFQGDGNNTRSIVTADHNTKKLQATFTDAKVHYRFENEKYMGITLYDQNGNEKKVISAEGQESSKNFAEQLNGVDFAYGDVIKVYHAESDRLKWYQKNEFVSNGKGKQELYFKLTEKGFERMEAEQEVTAVPQKVVIGTDAEKLEAKNFVQVKDGEVLGFVEKPNTTKIGEQKVKVETKDRFGNKKVTEVSLEVTYGDSIVYQGVADVTRSIITLNHAEKKLHATFTNDEIHYRFVNEQYIGLTIYDQNGNEKKHVTAQGQETSKNFAGQVNGTAFEYGDVLKVYHAEPSRLNWYKKNELVKKEDAMKGQEISFKITPNGLEQVQ
ncbi:putative mucin/carbohydrate-binding domain-containing protein [Bacillus thuringiensis]|uniref:putative mucin/carbohydrate-binding domain-containing protein n=1 Tax=Bacillus thuringiensis TaxID=1428 RepID=UPI000BF483D0|nr:putative mucin/carbohydrate-binding domain-containing protein [Bacillus thuringiensis]PFL42282.1 peptidase M60 [Bacillus thuringiensis]PGT71641.1 peptidase M60 [Bacillus thuringiensis]PGW40751.1 peptidase M60 [Bacillus thuringiensis]